MYVSVFLFLSKHIEKFQVVSCSLMIEFFPFFWHVIIVNIEIQFHHHKASSPHATKYGDLQRKTQLPLTILQVSAILPCLHTHNILFILLAWFNDYFPNQNQKLTYRQSLPSNVAMLTLLVLILPSS